MKHKRGLCEDAGLACQTFRKGEQSKNGWLWRIKRGIFFAAMVAGFYGMLKILHILTSR